MLPYTLTSAHMPLALGLAPQNLSSPCRVNQTVWYFAVVNNKLQVGHFTLYYYFTKTTGYLLVSRQWRSWSAEVDHGDVGRQKADAIFVSIGCFNCMSTTLWFCCLYISWQSCIASRVTFILLLDGTATFYRINKGFIWTLI